MLVLVVPLVVIPAAPPASMRRTGDDDEECARSRFCAAKWSPPYSSRSANSWSRTSAQISGRISRSGSPADKASTWFMHARSR